MNVVKALALGSVYKAQRWLNRAAALTLGGITHPRGGAGYLLLNRTGINYGREVTPDANSIVIACVRWVQRVYSEAPLMLQEWLEDRGEWEDHHRDDVLELLKHPNTHYNGTTLAKATVADYMLDGNAYWLIVRNQAMEPIQLWWAPHTMMEPKGDSTDPSIFISHYEYTPGGMPKDIRVEDVVHFRDGMDPQNPRRGLCALKSLMREIFTDDEAANMTASLLRNMGIPGVVISPKSGTIGTTAATQLKETFMEKTTGDKRGEPLVLQGDSTVTQIGFSPEQMGGRGLRGVPEERITSVLGVNAAVVGLGAGLATTKVGATLREYREEAFESTIIPMYREMAQELSYQLLPSFRDPKRWQIVHDLTKIRVLQEDEEKRSARIGNIVVQGLIKVSEGRRALGFPVEPEHEIYLRPVNLRQIPAGPLRVQTDPQPTGNTSNLALRRDAERLEAALESRLVENEIDPKTVLEAHYLLVGETTCATFGVDPPEDLGEKLLGDIREREPFFAMGARRETMNAQRIAMLATGKVLAHV